jgi:hypothetical protein
MVLGSKKIILSYLLKVKLLKSHSILNSKICIEADRAKFLFVPEKN